MWLMGLPQLRVGGPVRLIWCADPPTAGHHEGPRITAGGCVSGLGLIAKVLDNACLL
jgi:hypothetical protein